MSTNLTLNEPANVTTSLEHIDSIFSADVTHAALTLSYSRAGTYGYLSVLKSDGSVAYYADVYNGYKTEGPSRYVEYIIFNPDYVLSADVCIQDGTNHHSCAPRPLHHPPPPPPQSISPHCSPARRHSVPLLQHCVRIHLSTCNAFIFQGMMLSFSIDIQISHGTLPFK